MRTEATPRVLRCLYWCTFSCAKHPMQTFESEDNATPMALLSHHSPHDSVGVAHQHCPINNETAMRFMGYESLVQGNWRQIYQSIGADARAVRPYMPLACKSLFNRTNPKSQSLKFKLQSQQILKLKIQNSMFKGRCNLSTRLLVNCQPNW